MEVLLLCHLKGPHLYGRCLAVRRVLLAVLVV